jgi:hypothetical protein
MKRKLLNKPLLKTALAVPAAALMLGASQAGQVGLNFQDNWAPYYAAPHGGASVTATAFGLDATHWINVPMFYQSEWTPFVTNSLFILPDGGTISLTWGAKNTYSWPFDAASLPPGDQEVGYAYLDDSSPGYTVTLSGMRGFASSYTIQAVAGSDNASAFANVNLQTNGAVADSLNFSDPTTGFVAGSGGGSYGISTVSIPLGNDTVQLVGAGRNGSTRSTLAGFTIIYTPGNNPPLIETSPQTPSGTLYPGGSFSLSALASGTPALSYQWRKGGIPLGGATDTTYTKTGVGVGDSGNYDVVVTNLYGSVTSVVAAVTVQPIVSPVITQPPLSQSLYVGYPVTFTVAATGGLLAYQWKSNNVAIPGATGSSYTIPSIAANSGATYTVAVSNPVGPTATASATLTVLVPKKGSYEEAVAQTKPALWFRYSETAQLVTNTGVASNSGSTGSTDNGVAKFYTQFQQPGALAGDANKSAGFLGGQAIDIPYDAALNTATFTVELWANPTYVNTSGAQTPLYNRGLATGDGWLFWVNNTTTSWQFRTYTGTTRNTINSTASAVAGSWTHLVGVYDGTTTHFYVNGVEQGTGLITPFTPNGGVPLRIGAAGNDTEQSGVNGFVGGVDEVAIYNKILTPAEIQNHYANGIDPLRSKPYATLVQESAPVGYWRLNDAAGLTAPINNSGTLSAAWTGSYGGSVTPGTDGPQPATYPAFEATNHSVTVNSGYAMAPQLTLGSSATVVTWINRADSFTTGDLSWPAWLGNGGMHLNNGTTSGQGPYAELRYHWNGQQWGWGSGLVVPANIWTFCALVVEPTQATMYMSDGTALLSAVNSATHTPMQVNSMPGFGGNQPGSPGRNFIGALDESAVYDRALTPSEINALFMAGTGAKLKLQMTPGGVIEDTKPVGTKHHGFNTGASCIWVDSNTDAFSRTRTGVEQFATANPSQITIPADPDFDSPSGTICFWMQANAPIPDPGKEAAILFDRRTSTGTLIGLNDAGAIYWQGQGGAQNSLSAGYLPDLNWHHVAISYGQTTSDSISIYIDGQLAGSTLVTNAWSWPSGQQIELGRSHDNYWKRFDGLMDDFRLYNRVLTADEVLSIFNTDALVDTAALKLRFNFSTPGIGQTISWPFGTLLSSPVLGPGATWTPVTGATPPNYPVNPTAPTMFYGAAP